MENKLVATTSRRQIPATEKVAIIRRHLVEKVPISDLCDEFRVRPTQYYTWQKQFFENGAAAFERRNGKLADGQQHLLERVAGLETKLGQRSEAIAELLHEYMTLKATAADNTFAFGTKRQTQSRKNSL